MARYEDQEKADAVFIDQGYGTGIYSFGKTLKPPMDAGKFGGKSLTAGFANKRAEIWGKMKLWLMEGGVYPKTKR